MRHWTIILACAGLFAGPALADDQAPPPAAPPPAAAPAAPTAPATPSMSGPLAGNVSGPTFDLGFLGKKVIIDGAVTGLGLAQSNPVPGDRDSLADISNGQVWINKADGLVQYYVQVGIYSLPALGAPYVRSSTITKNTYGPLPQAFIKIAPSSSFSIEAGKLPTLVGAEYTFSFENMNIERGLLWGQEPAVSRGVQVNYVKGPLTLQASWNDGLYSDRYNWVSGAATWAVNSANTLEFVAAANLGKTYKSSFATPLVQDNEQIYNLIFTHTQGPWIIEPYVQYTHVPALPAIGLTHDGSTWGAALLVSYAFPAKSALPGFSLPVRVEYIASSGSVFDGSPNLLGFGPGSKAWSITATPTYQFKIWFVRAEVSYVDVVSGTAGALFGREGLERSQVRGLVETGLLF